MFKDVYNSVFNLINFTEGGVLEDYSATVRAIKLKVEADGYECKQVG